MLKTLTALTTETDGETHKLLDKQEAQTLLDLKLDDEPLLNEDWFTYEVMWLIVKLGYQTTYNFLAIDWNKRFIELNSKMGKAELNTEDIRKTILFDNPLMESSREKFLVDMEIFRNKPEVVVGGETCRKCNSDSTIAVESQTRSADEAQTIKIRCLQCGWRWQAQ